MLKNRIIHIQTCSREGLLLLQVFVLSGVGRESRLHFFLLLCCYKGVDMAGKLVIGSSSSMSSCDDLKEMLQADIGSKKMQKLKLSLVCTTIWMIWKERNAIVFRNKRRTIMLMEDDISIFTFN